MLIRPSNNQNTEIPSSLCSGPKTKFSHPRKVLGTYIVYHKKWYMYINVLSKPCVILQNFLYCEYLHAENNKSSKYKQVVTLELFNVTDHSLGNWCHWLGNFEFVEVEEFCPWFHSFPGLCDPFSGIYIGKWYRHPLNK